MGYEPRRVSWAELLQQAFARTGDDYSAMITTLSDEELHRTFDDGYGLFEGVPFTAWGERWVYFPQGYDGAEGVGYAPRNPCHIATQHWGGGVRMGRHV